jgi:antitoxin component YwqK of YwqJK toxin-antitoxin module/Tfp pilus assembly protein PilF
MYFSLRYCLILCFLFSFDLSIRAQTLQPPLNSGEVMNEGWKLSAAEKYPDAIKEFLKVDENDTNYLASQVELADLYFTAQKDSEAIALCDRMLAEPSVSEESFFIVKGNCLDHQEKKKEAIQVYNEALLKHPNSYLLYFNRGIVYLRQKDMASAQKDFQKAVTLNPYHASSHLRLGIIAFNQGRLIPAALSLMFFMQLENESQRASDVVVTFEKMLKREVEPDGPLVSSTDGDDFGDLEAIIKSKVALNGKYKSKIKLNYDLVKQLQLLMDKLTYNKGDHGFWMQTYVPFFTAMQKEGYFENYMYYSLKCIKAEPVDKWLKKHESDQKKYIDWVSKDLLNTLTVYDDDVNGTTMKANHYYYNDNKVQSSGMLKNGKKTGFWKFYYKNGQVQACGNVEDESREGPWKFYYKSGGKKEETNYEHNKANGPTSLYYENGALQIKGNYKDDKYDGAIESYFPSGVLKGSYIFHNGKKDGNTTLYYSTGEKQAELHYAEDVVTGTYTEYHKNGKVKSTCQFVADKRNGPYVEYHDNGVKKTEATVKEDMFVGPYHTYHVNGKLSEEGQYSDKGIYTGLSKKYSLKGELEEEYTYSERGKLIAHKYYTSKGQLENELIFKNEELSESKSYDSKGSVINDQKKKKDRFEVTFMTVTGNKKSEGVYVDGKRDGLWKFYDDNGYLTTTETHSDGKLNGLTTNYYCSGKVKSEINYTKGAEDGLYKSYYQNGTLERQGYYVKGQEQGYWYYFYVDGTRSNTRYYLNGEQVGKQCSYGVTGKLTKEETLKDGFITRLNYFDSTGKKLNHMDFPTGTGEVVLNYENGKPRLKGGMKNGFASGTYTWFYANGTVDSKTTYLSGDEDGSSVAFYENGNKKRERNYRGGKLNGPEYFYYENGVLEEQNNYFQGEEDSLQNTYYTNKVLSRQAHYFHGKANGTIDLYSEDGQLIVSKYLENDLLTSYTYLKSPGKYDSIPVVNETGKIEAYFPNGKKSLEQELVDGLINNKRTEYTPAGKIRKEENYSYGKLDGLQKYFYQTGSPKSEINYKLGEEHGYARYFYENGKVKNEGAYLNGSKSGPWKYYDETGKLTKTVNYYDNLEVF